MLVATFNDTTGWRGKTIAFEYDHFVLEGHGRVSLKNIMRYGEKGQLAWASDRMHAVVQSGVSFPTPRRAAKQSDDARRLLAALRDFAEGKDGQALQDLHYVLPGARTNLDVARGLLELTSAIRGVGGRRLRADCDELIEATRAAITALTVSSLLAAPKLVAAFNETTGWLGKTITFERDRFILEGHGRVSAANIMKYDEKGQLAWATEGTRAWVGARAADARTQHPAAADGPAKQTAPVVSELLQRATSLQDEGRYDQALAAAKAAMPGALETYAHASWLRLLADVLQDSVSEELRTDCDDLGARAATAEMRLHIVAQVDDCTYLGGSLDRHKRGERCALVFQDDWLIVRFHDGLDSHWIYTDVVALEIGGPGRQQSGGGFMGGGFGVDGAAAGMLVASALNLLTTRTRVKTVICLQTRDAELYLLSKKEAPDELRMRLSPVFVILRGKQETRREAAPVSPLESVQADLLARAGAGLATGLITDDEFRRMAAGIDRSDPG